MDSITFGFSPSNGDPTHGGSDTSRTNRLDGQRRNDRFRRRDERVEYGACRPGGDGRRKCKTFTGGGSAVTLDGSLTISDADSGGNLAGATVSIGAGFLSGDTLNFTNQNGITGSYNATTGVLILSGTASVANYQGGTGPQSRSASARATATRPVETIPAGQSVGRRLTAAQATAAALRRPSTLDVIHAAPAVTAGGSATFAGGGPAVTLDGSLTISDVDSGGTLAGATVSIGIGFLSGDTLNFTNQHGITGSYNAATGVLTLSGTATVAN